MDLHVHDGELMVVVGPSGCGKSTLLRILAGLEDITSGSLLIGQRVANLLSPQERNIAMVFQDYALYPTMTVFENLSFPLKMRRLAPADIRQRVERITQLLELGDITNRLPRELSGGQRQRVAMGRALVREPSVFLLDEPLSNLDAKLRAQVRTEIGELQVRTGATMIYVTHDQVEAMTLGKRITVINQGQIQQVADPLQLYEAPSNPFVAGFIGSPPMNLFEATLEFHTDNAWQLSVRGTPVAFVQHDRVAGFIAATGTRQKNIRSIHVTAGVRPEYLRLACEAESGIVARVIATEYLGHETLVHFEPGDLEHKDDPVPAWIGRLPGIQRFQKGDRLRLSLVESGFIHLFAPTS